MKNDFRTVSAALAVVPAAAFWMLTGPAVPGLSGPPGEDNPSPITRQSREPISERSTSVPAAGSPVWHDAVGEAMRGRHGIALVLDRRTERVLAAENQAAAQHALLAPGSTMKPLAIWALMEAGRLSQADVLACPRSLSIGSHDLECTHPLLAGPVTAESAIAYSCNNFVARYAQRFDNGQFAAFLRRQGLTAVHAATSPALTELQALGEEDVRATPLEMARAYARMADHAPKSVIDGLRDATEYGTARLANVAGLAGKTGTANGRAWFAGFTSDVVVVVVVPGGSGGADAAPVAKQILAPGGVWVRGRGQNEPPSYLTLDEYVAGVLAGECKGFRSAEAMKAMAIAIRTYAVRFRGQQHRREGFDFCSTTHCQVLRLDAVTARERDAAAATSGQLLWHEGSLASAYYSEDCGGMTEAAVNVWPDEDRSYLGKHEDGWCTREGRARWSVSIGTDELGDALRSAGLRVPRRIERVNIFSRTPAGRAVTVMVAGNSNVAVVSATTFRFAIGRRLGWNRVRSTFFNVKRDGNQFIVEGYGAGHGVGLCQKGADEMGAAGRGYREILAFYYPGTDVSQSAAGFMWQPLEGERVEVMTTEPRRDQHFVRIADTALRHAEQLTGLNAQFRPMVRIYPTIAAFRDATGEAGTIAGDTRGRVIRLQPQPSSQTVLHEMLHFLIEANAKPGTPRWLREGIVASLAGDPQVPPGVRQAVAEQGARAVVAGMISPSLVY